jgi:hypothetical protein
VKATAPTPTAVDLTKFLRERALLLSSLFLFMLALLNFGFLLTSEQGETVLIGSSDLHAGASSGA